MIDLHCHILPNIDDGSKSLEQSLEMARSYVQAGFKQVVATPHTVPGTKWMPSPATIMDGVAELNQAIRNESIHLTILPGAEVALDPLIPDLLKQGRIQTLAETSYVLIEPPFHRLPMGWENSFLALISKGYTPLLAHPERCDQLANKPEIFENMISMGIYFQSNWGSFLGQYGSKAQKTASYLASERYIHCLASDSHRPDLQHVERVVQAATLVEKIVGKQNLDLLARENPLRVLQGDPLDGMEADETRPEVKKREWRIFNASFATDAR